MSEIAHAKQTVRSQISYYVKMIKWSIQEHYKEWVVRTNELTMN